MKEQQQTVQTVPYPQHFEEDTIDLYEMLLALWKRKWLVIAVTVVATIWSLVFAHNLPPIYKAEARLLPPKRKVSQSMNILGIQKIIKETGLTIETNLNSEDVFSRFKQNLNSQTIHEKYIEEKFQLKMLAKDKNPQTLDLGIYNEFPGLINLREKNGITFFSIEMNDAKIAAQWTNDLIVFTDKETIEMLIEDLQNSIANRIVDIEFDINSKRLMAEKLRRDQIIRYSEQAEISN